MQRLALLVGANPRVMKCGPKVRLYEGKWKLGFVGVVDTLLSQQPVSNMVEDGQIIEGPCSIQLFLRRPGSETIISVFAELVE